MSKLKVESQWNDKNEMRINIPNSPHLHACLDQNFSCCHQFPNPFQYLLISLATIITLIIKNYTTTENINMLNLYLVIEAEVDLDSAQFNNISINIHLNSEHTPQALDKLQKFLDKYNPINNLLQIKDNIKINWD